MSGQSPTSYLRVIHLFFSEGPLRKDWFGPHFSLKPLFNDSKKRNRVSGPGSRKDEVLPRDKLGLYFHTTPVLLQERKLQFTYPFITQPRECLNLRLKFRTVKIITPHKVWLSIILFHPIRLFVIVLWVKKTAQRFSRTFW